MSILFATFSSKDTKNIDPNHAMIACEVLLPLILSTDELKWGKDDVTFIVAEDFAVDFEPTDGSKGADIVLSVTVTSTDELYDQVEDRVHQVVAVLHEVYGSEFRIDAYIELVTPEAYASNQKGELESLPQTPAMLAGLDEVLRRICEDDGVTLMEPDPAIKLPISVSEREPEPALAM